MIYIPKDLIKNSENEDKVWDILEKLDTDIKFEDCYTKEDAIKELQELNEDIIIEKLNNGFFKFGA